MTDRDSRPSASRIGDSPGLDEGGGGDDLRIARDGTWYHEGTAIRRPALVKLFSTLLRREDDGSYCLATPVERAPVRVEDVPFLAVELRASGRGRARALAFRTNVDDWVEADAAHPLSLSHEPETGAPRPYILVRSGLEARLSRAVFYELVALAEPEQQQGRERLGVWSKGSFFPLDG